MKMDEIEKLIGIIRDSEVSELTVSVGGTTVRLRKPLAPAANAPTPQPTSKAESPKAQEKPAAPVDAAPCEVHITAPMVGIFHSIDGIGTLESPVRSGQVVGVIESMKLMNDIVCEYDGFVAEILIEDGMPVEFGQRLFKLRTV